MLHHRLSLLPLCFFTSGARPSFASLNFRSAKFTSRVEDYASTGNPLRVLWSGVVEVARGEVWESEALRSCGRFRFRGEEGLVERHVRSGRGGASWKRLTQIVQGFGIIW